MEKIKNNLSVFLCAVTGLLGVIFSFLPAITYAMNAFGVEFDTTVNRFGAMGMVSGSLTLDVLGNDLDMEVDILGLGAGLFTIFAFIVSLALLVWGVLNLLKVFNVVSILPESVPTKTITDKLILANLTSNIFSFASLFVFCLDNQESQGGATAGLYVAVGVYLNLILAVLCFVGKIVLPKFLPATPVAAEEATEATEATTEETPAE